MKIKMLILLSFVILLLTSCSYGEINEMIFLDNNEYIDITLYHTSKEILEECKDKIIYYKKLFDRNQEYDEIENVYTVNKKRTVTVSKELAECIEYANGILSNYDCASLAAGGLNDLWYDAYIDKSEPSREAIEKELNIIKETKVEVLDTLVTITGDGNLDLDFMKRGCMLAKLLEYLKEKNVKEFIINDSSRTIIYGIDPNGKYFNCSFLGMKDGYYKIENIAMSCVGADINVWYAKDGYRFTTIPSCTIGKALDFYEKLFVFGQNPMLNDILAYAFFNMELEEVQKEEEKYGVYAMMYKELNLVYRNEYLTNLMID